MSKMVLLEIQTLVNAKITLNMENFNFLNFLINLKFNFTR